jgi:hypothetical protein
MGSPPPAIQIAQNPSRRALNAEASTAGSPGSMLPGDPEPLQVLTHGLQLGVPEPGQLGGEYRVDHGGLPQGLDFRLVRPVGAPVHGDAGAQRRFLGQVVAGLTGGQFLARVGDPVGQQCLEHLLLAREVLVERAGRAACLSGDVGDLGIEVAAAGEYRARGLLQRDLGLRRLGPAAPARRLR